MTAARLIVILAMASPAAAAQPRRVSVPFSAGDPDPARDTRRFALSPEAAVVGGRVALAGSVLVADEAGATDGSQTLALTDRVWAKKSFPLDSADAGGAELLFFGKAAAVVFNGEPLPPSEKLVSTGWQRVAVPPKLLRAGGNDVVFKGKGSLLFEPSAKPGRSARSPDGGGTWDATDLGGRGPGPGEFVARLRLKRHAPSGWAESAVVDLWAPAGGIATPGRVTVFAPLATGEQPEGTAVRPLVRLGPTPEPGDGWTAWHPLDRGFNPPETAARFRWAQLRFELSTARPLASPALPARFELACDFTPDPTPPGWLKLVTASGTSAADALPRSFPFAYQEPSAKLARLRQRYELDKVIAPGKSEMEQLVLLRHWVRNQWHTGWEGSPAAWVPPWDAVIILGSAERPDCFTMCTHYSAVFTQCCLALGWTARHCILDHHCVSEVYVDQHRKWVMLDTGNSKPRPDCSLHFERAGVPLSALELHAAVRDGATSDLTVCFTPPRLMAAVAGLCRAAPPYTGKADSGPTPRPDSIPAADLPKYPVCGLEHYRRYALPARNTYLASPFPGELQQGYTPYFYNGYWWVGDSPDAPVRSPEYSRHLDPARPHEIDWPLNWTRPHLETTATPGELRVTLETRTPNLARLEARRGADAAWKPTPAAFVWKLSPGRNELTVRGVNRFDRPGHEGRVAVEWTPASK